MAERWLPVLAASLGLVGGVAGAAVGGYVANTGQEQRFQEEREARIRDLRIDTYAKFLRAVENEKVNNAAVADSLVLTAEVEVALLASTDALRQAAARLSERARNWDVGEESEYTASRERFVDLAHDEIDAGE